MLSGDDEVMTFYFQKGQLYCDMIMFYTNTFLAIIKTHMSGTEIELVTTFPIRSNNELVTLILAAQNFLYYCTWLLLNYLTQAVRCMLM